MKDKARRPCSGCSHFVNVNPTNEQIFNMLVLEIALSSIPRNDMTTDEQLHTNVTCGYECIVRRYGTLKDRRSCGVGADQLLEAGDRGDEEFSQTGRLHLPPAALISPRFLPSYPMRLPDSPLLEMDTEIGSPSTSILPPTSEAALAGPSFGSDETPPTLDLKRHEEFWLYDGSVVLAVGDTLFRVHKTVLANHSEVFADLFTVPQPLGEDTIDGCHIVRLHDNREDFIDLLRAMYQPE